MRSLPENNFPQLTEGVRQESVNVNGCRLSYFVQGNGPPIVWIQGVGSCASAWKPQIEFFSRNFTCVSIDNRGLGGSQPAGEVSVSQMACDVEAIRSQEGWNKIHIVGHSLGGLIALQYALNYTANVRTFASLCSFANGRSVAPMFPSMLYWGARTAVGTAAMRRYAFLRLILTKTFIDQNDVTELAQQIGDLMGRDLAHTPAIVKKQLAALRRCDLTNRLPSIVNVPTMIVSATHDLIAVPELGRNMAKRIPNATYVELGDCSHGAPIQNATEVNRLLERHFAM